MDHREENIWREILLRVLEWCSQNVTDFMMVLD